MDGLHGHRGLRSPGKFSALSQPPRETALPAQKYPGILSGKLCPQLQAESCSQENRINNGQIRADRAMGHHVGKGVGGSLHIENMGI